jgi:GNAT superfamily N-acetyltransferase
VSAVALRPATLADAEAIAAVTAASFELYREFAPEGWEPPPGDREIDRARELLGDDEAWWLVAEGDGKLAGHTSFVPVSHSVHVEDDPELAHVRALFVTPEHWGTGLATRLHAAALEEARARGFTRMRLFTPAGQGRARRFYEREGWTLTGSPQHEPALGLVLVEYRRALLE